MHHYSRVRYVITFFGLVDLAAIFPFYLQQILDAADVQFDATVFRVVRLVRIFQLEHFSLLKKTNKDKR